MSSDAPLDVAGSLRALEANSPLVHSITNDVTVNEVANVTLLWGGLPVMADDRREVAEMVAGASALHLNMGTVSEDGEETMVAAGQAANERGVPVVFDPVGAGATPTRDRVAARLCEEVDLAVVKGNYGEVSALAGDEGEVRGVESMGEYADIAASARRLSRETGAVVVASGEADVVAGEEAVYTVDGGDGLLTRVVGTGCLLGVSAATFCGVTDDPLRASLDACVAFGVAAERAAASDVAGPASFKVAFLDAVAALSPEDLPAPEALAERVRRAD
ncbi:hydroxyethylthiazole kinase [Halomarina litorea]|uniref:hydroxyethylthiazole kinase n=1 Tax=Halomarina litorea TaxID=2961595 RepID=UPI0020C28890|nr:hydroxyethylthiazole kinase [Halomarina sp. BCD28]